MECKNGAVEKSTAHLQKFKKSKNKRKKQQKDFS